MRDRATASVEAIERAILILDVFSVDRPELGVAEITRATGLKRSTVHRALASLESGGLLKQDPATQKYGLGSKVVRLAHILESQTSLTTIAMPHMKVLRDRFNETIALHVLDGQTRVVVQQVESTHDLRRTYHEMGKQLPLYAGSPGKVILAFLPPGEIREIIADTGLSRFTGKTIADPEALLADLEEIRRQGFATSVGERSDGISSISCPVRDRGGRVVASINISGPEQRFTRSRALECLSALRAATRAVSRELGYAGSFETQ